MIDPNDIETSGSRNERSGDNGSNADMNQSNDRPYGDAGNLYEIPRTRPEDPPMRQWWTDDEPHQSGNGSSQNG